MISLDWFSNATFTWVNQNAGVFLPEALKLYQTLSVLYVLCFGAVFAFDALVPYRTITATSGLKALGTLVLVGLALRYYVVPTPVLGGMSLHQVLPHFGTYLTNLLNHSSLNACMQEMDKLLGAQNPPGWKSPWMQIVCYAVLTGLVWFLQGVMILLTIVANIFLAVGIVFGPLLLVCRLIPIGWVQAKTAQWFQFMLHWSMFSVVAAAVVAVWAAMMLFVLNAAFHGVYKGVEIILAVKLFIVLNLAFAFIAWRVERIADSLFGGVSGATGFADFVKGKVL